MSGKNKQSKMLWILTFPIRALIKARDSYVKGMSSFAERGAYGGFTAPPPVSRNGKQFPKSCSVSSSSGSSYQSEDMRELIRAASVRRMGGRLTEELSRRPPAPTVAAPAEGVVPRSCSVGMGKIDENSPCEFGEEEYGGLGVVRAEVLYPRSKSYAVAMRSPLV